MQTVRSAASQCNIITRHRMKNVTSAGTENIAANASIFSNLPFTMSNPVGRFIHPFTAVMAYALAVAPTNTIAPNSRCNHPGTRLLSQVDIYNPQKYRFDQECECLKHKRQTNPLPPVQIPGHTNDICSAMTVPDSTPVTTSNAIIFDKNFANLINCWSLRRYPNHSNHTTRIGSVRLNITNII